jgi:xanthine dehydrogenase accessory factor
MKTVLDDITRWLARAQPVVLARVVEVVGSGIRAPGAAIAVAGSGEVAGSASGGCVEGAIVQEARAALVDDGRPRLRTFGCSDDEAFDVGLTCGGIVRVLIERLDPPAPASGGPPTSWVEDLAAKVRSGTGVALVEIVDGPDDLLGSKAVVAEDGTSVGFPTTSSGAERTGPEGTGPENTHVEPDMVSDALADLAAERSATHRHVISHREATSEVTLFVDTFPSPPQMIIVGAASFTAALTAQAKLLGYHVVVCDARAVFASASRFPLADEVIVDWPDRFLARTGAYLGERDAICVLSHDPKFDVPTIVAALGTGVGYIGVMGSRRAQAHRRRQLSDVGVSDAGLERLRGPIGLDLGASSPEETAVSIMAEIIAVRRGRSGSSLASVAGPIHSRGVSPLMPASGRPSFPGPARQAQ